MQFMRLIGYHPHIVKPDTVVLMTAITNHVPEGGKKSLGFDLILEKRFRLHQLAYAVGAESQF
jgi:hypothetical protein